MSEEDGYLFGLLAGVCAWVYWDHKKKKLKHTGLSYNDAMAMKPVCEGCGGNVLSGWGILSAPADEKSFVIPKLCYGCQSKSDREARP